MISCLLKMTRNISRKNTFVCSKNITGKNLDVLYFHYGILKKVKNFKTLTSNISKNEYFFCLKPWVET